VVELVGAGTVPEPSWESFIGSERKKTGHYQSFRVYYQFQVGYNSKEHEKVYEVLVQCFQFYDGYTQTYV
jgi:hypothetical protein